MIEQIKQSGKIQFKGGLLVIKKVVNTTLKTVLFFIGWAVLCAFIPLLNTDNAAIWRLWAEITPLIAIIAFTFVFWHIEKKQINLCLLGNPAKGLSIGSIGGVAWLGCSVLILFLFSVIKFDGSNDVSMLPIWLLASIFNVVMQELLVRGYLYQMIKQKHNLIVATVVTTGIFTALHGGAFETGMIPVLNVATMSLLMTVVLEYTGSIIAPVIMHGIWNSVGAIIIGGVSLAEDYPHLLNVIFSGNSILSGGACKIEGSVIVLAVNILMIFVFILLRKKRKA